MGNAETTKTRCRRTKTLTRHPLATGRGALGGAVHTAARRWRTARGVGRRPEARAAPRWRPWTRPSCPFARSAMATQMRFEPSETPFASPRVGSRSTPSARYRPRSCTSATTARANSSRSRRRQEVLPPHPVRTRDGRVRPSVKAGVLGDAARAVPVSHPRVNAHVTSSSFITERFCSRLVQSSRRRLTLRSEPLDDAPGSFRF